MTTTNVKPIGELIADATKPESANASDPRWWDIEKTCGSKNLMPGEELQVTTDFSILTRIEEKIDGLLEERSLTALAESGQLAFNSVKLVETFHDAFGVPVEPAPCVPDDARVTLRLELLTEELGELRTALTMATSLRSTAKTIPPEAFVRIAKELADVQYVLDGTFIELGLGAVKGHLMNAVHMSNMTKLGPDGKPVYRGDGKVMKGENYVAPDEAIAEILAFGASQGTEAKAEGAP